MDPDKVNSIFVFLGGVLNWKSVYILYKQKEIKGIYWPVNILYMIWGIWNIIYFSKINQVFSFYSNILLVGANIFWVVLALYYNKEYNKWKIFMRS